MIRKITFVSMAILIFISIGIGVSRSFAKARLSDFEEVDAYISTKMDELGIPGAALVIVQGDQIVHLRRLELPMLTDARSRYRRHSLLVPLANRLLHLPSCNWLKQARSSWIHRYRPTCHVSCRRCQCIRSDHCPPAPQPMTEPSPVATSPIVLALPPSPPKIKSVIAFVPSS